PGLSRSASAACVTGAALVATYTIAAYSYGVDPGTARTPVSLPAAVALAALALAVLFTKPGRATGLLLDRGPEGMLARRLLPAILLIPLALGFLRLQAQEAGWLGLEQATALFAFLNVVVLGAVAGILLRRLADALAAREAATRERRAFFDLSLDLLSIVGLDGRFREVNPAWTATLGWSRQELVGRPFLEFVHPDDVERTQQEAGRLATTGLPVPFENRYRARDGSYRWLRWTSAVEPHLGVYVSVASDVTQQREASMALQASEARLRAVLDNASDAIVTLDAAGHVVGWNRGASRLFGIDEADAAGRPVASLLRGGPPDLLAHLQELQAGRAQRRRWEPVEAETVPAAAGRAVPVEVAAGSWRAADGARITLVLRDLSQRKQAEAQARVAQERFARVFDVSPLPITMTRDDGTFAAVNDAFCRLTGYTREELLDPAFHAEEVWDDPGERRRLVADMRTRGLVRDRQVVLRRKDGLRRTVLASVEYVDMGGDTTALAILQDVTERVRSQEEREARIRGEVELERLRKLEEFRTDFINSTAHELATPLTPLVLQTHLLRASAQTPEQVASVAAVERSVERLRTIVQDLLTAADAQARALRFDPVETELDDELHAAITRHRDQAAAAGQSIEVEPGGLRVRVDVARLHLALGHLVGNAVKFSPKGGRIVVRSREQGGFARIEVADQGPGLTRTQAAQLWRPYAQVHDKMQFTKLGSGLGLYVTKGIIELHGGEVGVESGGPGTGSTFWVTVPLAGWPPPPSA
ncbi:MAG TPA: PAS domain S-box protein, partial [Candidatus Thermoplasmatota archaeon]|nr:PAS domain S-box protein [Candidatus Thermoplasmatota archaeon]